MLPFWIPVKLNGTPPVPCRPPEPLLQIVPPGGVPEQTVALAMEMLSAKAGGANRKLARTSRTNVAERRPKYRCSCITWPPLKQNDLRASGHELFQSSRTF